MKIILATLNAKYIHINLAIRSIGKYCNEFSPIIKEYTINDNIDNIIASLYLEKADLIAFSCYIWNIDKILYISKMLKSVQPGLKILLGGHEVSYNTEELMEENPHLDFIIRGEGEKPCKILFECLEKKRSASPTCVPTEANSGGDFSQQKDANSYTVKNDGDLKNVPSLTYRENGQIIQTSMSCTGKFCDYPFPYDETIRDFKGKIVYYESSRGCPYSCSYCLSGNNSHVDYLDIDRVKRELMFFIERDVPLVKFVDRTFNADKRRAAEIFQFIIEHKRNTRFHFELAGSLIDDEIISVLKTAPKGLLQFEIGVQSTNEETIKSIGRKISFEKVFENVRKIMELRNIHVHLDLIAGLPYENMESFKKSFDDCLKIRPNVLQLGFLKLLKGSKLRDEAEKYGYIYKTKAPYEVMKNDFISFDEIIKLKFIEDIFEKYYNSGDFKRSLDFLIERFSSPFEIFEKIYDYYNENALFERAVSLEDRYDVLNRIFKLEGFSDYVKSDLFTNTKAKTPYEPDLKFKEQCFEFLKNKENIENYLPCFKGKTAREIYKRVRFAKLFGGIYLYNTQNGEFFEVEL